MTCPHVGVVNGRCAACNALVPRTWTGPYCLRCHGAGWWACECDVNPPCSRHEACALPDGHGDDCNSVAPAAPPPAAPETGAAEADVAMEVLIETIQGARGEDGRCQQCDGEVPEDDENAGHERDCFVKAVLVAIKALDTLRSTRGTR